MLKAASQGMFSEREVFVVDLEASLTFKSNQKTWDINGDSKPWAAPLRLSSIKTIPGDYCYEVPDSPGLKPRHTQSLFFLLLCIYFQSKMKI